MTALENQVRALTERVRVTEQDAAAARVLAGGADRDVGEFREQNTRVLNAMREDLGDLRQQVADGFTEMRGKLDQTAAGQDHLAALLTRLIEDQGDR